MALEQFELLRERSHSVAALELEFTNERLSIELPWMLQPVGLNISPNGIFMAIFYHIATPYNYNVIREPLQDVSRTNEEVLWRHVSAVVENCNAESLDARQVRSLRHFASWMALTNRTPNKRLGILLEAAGHPQAETTTATPPPLPSSGTKVEDKHSESGVESCPICDCGVLVENLDSWECLNHHKWGRCMHSLLVCDESPNRRCRIILLALVDHRYRFRYVNVVTQGRCHAAHVYRRSAFAADLQGPTLETPMVTVNRAAVPLKESRHESASL
ncbi:hypothetical protein IscW_ISCW010095 [Ixodes scapularis]|uniref:Transcription factor IIIC putative zinc-finger domain-containing protein n=1 Tax=Ixodes scapularis TaxID=6945 RepID=B7Q3D6_IXOSC|nr:hypothetical protein IscW_ISCW010095 [Ixodes scapularis]|eukprot:XP_002411234.1 hypothetical protein IscW_ISCW010095 [Ixodes scapularis]